MPKRLISDLRNLEFFDAVVNAGGVKGAHIDLDVAPSLVSTSVRRLEGELGAKLYNYEGKELVLTEAGRRLNDLVRPFLKDFRDLEASFKQADESRISIGAADIVLSRHLPDLVAALRKSWAQMGRPELNITLTTMLAESMESAVADLEVDLAITAKPSKLIPGLHFEPLLPVPVVLLARVDPPFVNDFAAIEEQARANNDIVPYPLIALPESDPMRKNFKEQLDQRNLSWPVTIEVNSLALVRAYAQAGCGYGLTFHRASSVGENLREIPLPDFGMLELGILHRKTLEELKEVAQKFVAIAKFRANQMLKDGA